MKPGSVIPDPHVVYRDAVLSSPWNREISAHLPQRGDWSTFRYAVKDIILGVATHRYDRARRCLCVRAWFVGEHRAYASFEPTRILFLVLASQAWQAGHRLDLWFEEGIPWDLRLWIEERSSIRISGHEDVLPHDLASRLYRDLAGLPLEIISQPGQFAAPEHIAFHIHRGTWSSWQVQEMARRGVKLDHVFHHRPDPVTYPLAYLHLLRHLVALIIEDFTLARLAGREEGTRVGLRFAPSPRPGGYVTPSAVYVSGPDHLTTVDLTAGEHFRVVPILETTVNRCLPIVRTSYPDRPVFAFPLDIGTVPASHLDLLTQELACAGKTSIGIGATLLQLKTEAELRLAVTASQEDETEVLDAWDTRYAE